MSRSSINDSGEEALVWGDGDIVVAFVVAVAWEDDGEHGRGVRKAGDGISVSEASEASGVSSSVKSITTGFREKLAEQEFDAPGVIELGSGGFAGGVAVAKMRRRGKATALADLGILSR